MLHSLKVGGECNDFTTQSKNLPQPAKDDELVCCVDVYFIFWLRISTI